MRTPFPILFLLFTASTIAACPKSHAPSSNAEAVKGSEESGAAGVTEKDSERVCCESFGYGAMMAKCCETYEWTTPEACSVDEGFTGGGKVIVANDKCGGVPSP